MTEHLNELTFRRQLLTVLDRIATALEHAGRIDPVEVIERVVAGEERRLVDERREAERAPAGHPDDQAWRFR